MFSALNGAPIGLTYYEIYHKSYLFVLLRYRDTTRITIDNLIFFVRFHNDFNLRHPREREDTLSNFYIFAFTIIVIKSLLGAI